MEESTRRENLAGVQFRPQGASPIGRYAIETLFAKSANAFQGATKRWERKRKGHPQSQHKATDQKQQAK